MKNREDQGASVGPGCEASPSAADGVSAESHPSRWRFWLIFPLVIVGSCWMLLLDTVRGLLQAIHRGSFSVLMAVIKWGASDSDGPRMAETEGLGAEPDQRGPKASPNDSSHQAPPKGD